MSLKGFNSTLKNKKIQFLDSKLANDFSDFYEREELSKCTDSNQVKFQNSGR